MANKLTTRQIRTAKAIAKAADAGGTIQAHAMRDLQLKGLLPNEPTLVTAMSVERAWKAAGLPENTSELLWG